MDIFTPHPELLYPYGGTVLAPVAAAYLASVISRLSRRRGRRPGWVSGVIPIFVGVFTTWICTFQLDPFFPSRWATVGGKVDLSALLVVTGFLATVFSIVPTIYVIGHHRKIFDQTHSVV